jgi:hypothetical protein
MAIASFNELLFHLHVLKIIVKILSPDSRKISPDSKVIAPEEN